MSDNLVQEFYTRNVREEWRRLAKDAYHRLEFDTTLHYLQKYLPTHALILDAGGGPGRYTIELAKRGYDLTLLDATQANLDFASRQVKRNHLRTGKEIITDHRRYFDVSGRLVRWSSALVVSLAHLNPLQSHGNSELALPKRRHRYSFRL
jgi:2-polyprenyl-3-methyl-5-hydroxy-6-metoxy-1,4-benzoquinol methylase